MPLRLALILNGGVKLKYFQQIFKAAKFIHKSEHNLDNQTIYCPYTLSEYVIENSIIRGQ